MLGCLVLTRPVLFPTRVEGRGTHSVAWLYMEREFEGSRGAAKLAIFKFL